MGKVPGRRPKKIDALTFEGELLGPVEAFAWFSIDFRREVTRVITPRLASTYPTLASQLEELIKCFSFIVEVDGPPIVRHVCTYSAGLSLFTNSKIIRARDIPGLHNFRI